MIGPGSRMKWFPGRADHATRASLSTHRRAADRPAERPSARASASAGSTLRKTGTIAGTGPSLKSRRNTGVGVTGVRPRDGARVRTSVVLRERSPRCAPNAFDAATWWLARAAPLRAGSTAACLGSAPNDRQPVAAKSKRRQLVRGEHFLWSSPMTSTMSPGWRAARRPAFVAAPRSCCAGTPPDRGFCAALGGRLRASKSAMRLELRIEVRAVPRPPPGPMLSEGLCDVPTPSTISAIFRLSGARRAGRKMPLGGSPVSVRP